MGRGVGVGRGRSGKSGMNRVGRRGRRGEEEVWRDGKGFTFGSIASLAMSILMTSLFASWSGGRL